MKREPHITDSDVVDWIEREFAKPENAPRMLRFHCPADAPTYARHQDDPHSILYRPDLAHGAPAIYEPPALDPPVHVAVAPDGRIVEVRGELKPGWRLATDEELERHVAAKRRA